MDINHEQPFLEGYLNIPTQSGFSLTNRITRISKQKPYQRYCLLFNSSRHGIERLEIYENKDDKKTPKIITLENCVKISQEGSPAYLIHIVKKTGILTLNTQSEDDLKLWINALQSVAFRNKNNANDNTAIEEDNDLYCSSFGDGMFIVTLVDSPSRCNFEPRTYMLHLTGIELQLKITDDSSVIANWPYRFIRKYGYRDGKFTFEAGRKCSTGEGVFTLDHTSPQEIFRCMSSKMKSMKKLISSERCSDSVENHLSVAAAMEAGSRSPLPPSKQQLTDFEINSMSSSSLLGVFPSNDSVISNINISASSSSKHNHLKNTICKPPRSFPQSFSSNNNTVPLDHICQISSEKSHYKNYEPVSITTLDPNKNIGSTVILNPLSPEPLRSRNYPPDLPVRNELKPELNYECITPRTNAWMSLGINIVNHTERNSENCDNTVTQKNSAHLLSEHTNSPKIVNIDFGEISSNNSIQNDDSYDRLNFLFPNNQNSNGYKTVVAVTSNSNRSRTPPTSNDYELIGNGVLSCSREDNKCELSYAVFNNSETAKKISLKDTIFNEKIKLETPNIYQRSYNGINYTTVSKPKRV